MEFSESADRVLDTAAARGAVYADVRIERTRSERIEVRNGDVASMSDERSDGFGVRALVDGAWGFAASARFDRASLDDAASRAVAMATRRCACGPAIAGCTSAADGRRSSARSSSRTRSASARKRTSCWPRRSARAARST
jgi:predicted Zn-dependent protease